MVKKKNNANSNNNQEKTDNLHFNLNNLDGENFKEEASLLFNAINKGKLNLDPKEKENLLQEVDLILNHFNQSKTKDESLNTSFISKNFDKDVNSDFKNDVHIKNQSNSDIVNNSNSDGVIDFSDEVLDEKSSSYVGDNHKYFFKSCSDKNSYIKDFNDSSVDDVGDVLSGDFVEDGGSDDLSVDDALNELVDFASYSKKNNDSSVDDVGDVLSGDFVEDGGSDNVLIELVDDVSYSMKDEVLIELVDDVSSDIVEDGGSDDLSVDDALNDLIVNYSDEVAIKVENLSMQFTVSKDKIDTLKEFVIRTVKRNKSVSKIIPALKDVSFEILKGDRVGIIGFNGAGKSTLLKVLAGVYDATEGTIETKGKIAPLLELGAGFDPNYTGKDNIFLNGAFLGYPEDFLKEKYDEILEFSELGDAINYHVKTYSSGMRAKLAFSIATIVEPDILIIDEILSVGDIKFKKKSADKIHSLIHSGITVLLVSHSVAQIRDLCNKAIWIDDGKLKMYGDVNQVCDAYVKAANNATKEQLEHIKLDY